MGFPEIPEIPLLYPWHHIEKKTVKAYEVKV